MADARLRRRSVLTGGALLAAGAPALLVGCSSSDEPGDESGDDAGEPAASTTPPRLEDLDLSDWEVVRGQFALDPELAHFAAFVLASHPAPVRAAIERWRDAFDADPAATVAGELAHDEEVRTAAAGYLGVRPAEVALTDSTTMGLGLVYHGLPLCPGDHVLTTTHDFYATHEALRLAAARAGAEVERIALYDDPAAAGADELAGRVAAAIRPQTKVVALTWVHSSTGVKLPVRAIADAVADANAGRAEADRAILVLDAIHGLGADAARPGDLGCDVFVSGTHKWLFGPRGTGIVWAAPAAGAAVAPTIPSFTAPSFVNWLTGGDEPSPFGVGNTPGGYQAFEHRWAVTEAFAFHQAIGPDRVAARTQELATRLKDGLAELPGVRLVTPRDPALSAGLVCVDVAGRDPAEVVQQLLDQRIVASVTPYSEPYVRFGASIVTTPEQVDAAVEAVAGLAR
ncbi:aminotransferase class V-fold PLP-dependent enzyme [Jiangella rhizosphaerae]|uniref:Aminotransferase class V-fold PLP-dependent enzyme n=1 Tax=Jiangella rhizosphaerae TaxID=2293569 RepID=A0A418KR73_9ACTN|nr:aminotransferase class V-fold PLP-dependent enzyme [Jiangella rhizosphaerae]RIQ24369.1 aminotransferase class V-fold PLP-dependent enzyme [Jiangella rhizosphaerae]